MKLLLDTSVVSELRKPPSRVSPDVLAWSQGTLLMDQFLSVITLQELKVGVLSLARRDSAAADALARWYDGLTGAFRGRILPVSVVVAEAAAAMHVPDRRPVADALIAATAQVHRLTVVTRNVHGFAELGVSVLSPWDA